MKIKRFWIFLSILALTGLACQLGSAPIQSAPPTTQVFEEPVRAPDLPMPEVSVPGDAQELLVALYERVMPGVVSIQVADGNKNKRVTGSLIHRVLESYRRHYLTALRHCGYTDLPRLNRDWHLHLGH